MRPAGVGSFEVVHEATQQLGYRATGDRQQGASEQAPEQLRDVPGSLGVQVRLARGGSTLRAAAG